MVSGPRLRSASTKSAVGRPLRAGLDRGDAVAVAESAADRQPGAATDAQLVAAASTFDLLSVPGRLHLVWLLATDELDVTTLAELTAAKVPAVSQQLAKLRAAGVVSARRDGRRQLYRVDDPHILSVIAQMFSHIAPDGTLAPDPARDRPPRHPRFS